MERKSIAEEGSKTSTSDMTKSIEAIRNRSQGTLDSESLRQALRLYDKLVDPQSRT